MKATLTNVPLNNNKVDPATVQLFLPNYIDYTNEDESVIIGDAIEYAKLKSINQLTTELEQTNTLPPIGRWSNLGSLNMPYRNGGRRMLGIVGTWPGIYAITHIDDQDDGFIWYVGCSSMKSMLYTGSMRRDGKKRSGGYGISSRISELKRIFRNAGMPISHIHGANTSGVAAKMHNKDPNLNNWNVKTIRCPPLDEFIKNLETKLIDIYDPPFNDKTAAGL